MRIAISGHRPNKLDNDYDLMSPLIKEIKSRIEDVFDKLYTTSPEAEYQPLELITGMALGVDTLFAKIAVELEIPFTAAIPFKGQDNRWGSTSRTEYWGLLRHAERVVDVSTGKVYNSSNTGWKPDFNDLLQAPSGIFSSQAMQRRNEWMVDHSDLLIAVWDGSSGGTSNCVYYAKTHGKSFDDRTIIWIDPIKVRQELGILVQ